MALIEEVEEIGDPDRIDAVDLIVEVAGIGGAERIEEVHLIGAAARTAGEAWKEEPILRLERQ